MALDNLGREIGGNIPTNALVKGLTKDVSEVMETKDTQSNSKLDSLLQATRSVADAIGDNLTASTRAAGNYAQQIIQTFQSIYQKESKQENTGNKEQAAFSKSTVDLISKIYKLGKSPNTFWVGLGHFHPQAITQMRRMLSDCGLCKAGASNAVEVIQEQAARRSGGGGGGGGGSSGVNTIGDVLGGDTGSLMGGSGGGGDGGASNSLNMAATGLVAASFALAGAAKRVVAAFNVDVMGMFDGVLTESNVFREQLRQIVFQTRGFGNENRAIEDQYRHITNSVEATGSTRGKYQQLFLQNLQRGVAMENALDEAGKDYNKVMENRIRKTKTVQTTAMNTANQLNMSVDGMNSMFMDWRMHLGMSVLEIQSMGRGMQEVARATGLTGSELEKAVKSSESIMKSMKNAGRLSAESSKAVMGMMASAQKYGVGDQMGKMMEALSSPRGFMEASNQMKALMVTSAQLGGGNGLATRVIFGQATSPDDLLKMSEGFKKNMGSFLEGFGIDDKFIKQDLGIEGGLDLTNLSSVIQELEMQGDAGRAKARSLQLSLEQAYGMGVGEIEQMAKAMNEAAEANKPYGERLEKMTAELQKMEDAGMGASDAANELKARMKETNTNALQEGMLQWQKSVQKSGGDLDLARQDLEQRLQGTMGPEMAKSFASDIGGSANELLKDLGKRAEAQGKDLNNLLEKRGFTAAQLKKSITSGSAEEMENAMSILGEAQQEISRAERTGQDPMSSIRDQLVSLNNKLGYLMDSVFFKIPDTLFKILFWTAQVGGLIASLVGFFMGGAWISGLLGGPGVGAVMSGAGSLMGTAGTAASGITMAGVATVGGTIAAAVMALTGAVKGFSEAEKAGRSKLAGTLLGVLTGSAGTKGGFVGGMLGTKEGSTADKAAGVASATLWGGALGTAVGIALAPLTGGLSLLVGPVLGALIGGVTQLFKIVTAGTTIIEDLLQPFQIIIDFWIQRLTDVWGIIKGIFTLDFGSVIDHAMSLIIGNLLLIPSLVWAGIKRTFITIPQLILTSLKALIVGIPMLIWNSIKSALENLSSSEWVGPIFKTLSDAFNEIYNVVMSIYKPIGEAFDAIIGAFQSVGEALFGSSKEGSTFTFILGLVKGAVHALATVIGFVLKPVVWLAQAIGLLLKPVVWLAQAFKWVAESIAGLVKDIVSPFKWLYDVLVGHSIVPDLVFDIVKFFAMLPYKILKSLAYLGIQAVKFFFELPFRIMQGLGKLESTKAIGGMISDTVSGAWESTKAIGGMISDTVSGAWESTKGIVKGAVSGVLDTGKSVLNAGGEMVTNALSSAMSPIKTVSNVVSNVGGGLANAGGKLMQGNITGAIGGVINTINPFNMFKTNPTETIAATAGENKQSIDKQNHNDSLKSAISVKSKTATSSDVIAQNMGAFSPDAPADALARGVSEKVSGAGHGMLIPSSENKEIGSNLKNALGTKESTDKKTTMADAGKGLYYEMDKITNSVINSATNPIGATSILNAAGNAAGPSSAQANAGTGLDYKEQIKGQASATTAGLNSIQQRIESEKAGSESGGTSTAMGMSGVEGLLHEEVSMMRMVYETLVAIKENTSGKAQTRVIDAPGKGGRPAHAQGVKSIAMDYVRGYWDLTTGDYAPPAVTSDGRGGN